MVCCLTPSLLTFANQEPVLPQYLRVCSRDIPAEHNEASAISQLSAMLLITLIRLSTFIRRGNSRVWIDENVTEESKTFRLLTTYVR